VIAGLLDNRVTENLSQIPGLAHLPILGALFKSRSLTKSKTELVVIVTPETASPLLPTDPKPSPHMLRDFLPNEASEASRQKPAAKADPGGKASADEKSADAASRR
jgi:pilus assembly protein CpaC